MCVRRSAGEIGKRFDTRYNLPHKIEQHHHLKMVTLSSLCAREPDYGVSATAIERSEETQLKYIRITDFSDYGIEDNHVFTTVKEYTQKHILQDNDILFARSGATVGKTFQYHKSLGSAVFAGYCIRFSIDRNKAIPQYIYYFTKTVHYANWVRKLQRPSGQPNINKEEFKSLEIPLPSLDTQRRLVTEIETAAERRTLAFREADSLLAGMDEVVLERLGIDFPKWENKLTFAVRRRDLLDSEIYCRPSYPAFGSLISALKGSRYYCGTLGDFIDVNPKTERTSLVGKQDVSFVPMTSVGNRDNTVAYETRKYDEVKSGYTIFKRGDLLWAKITPCMQNGKSCIVDELPTEIGFGSTEFHVLRQRSDRIYMPYLWIWLASSVLLSAAQAVFNGSAGQQRVSDSFLKNLPLPLPDIQLQKELANTAFTNRTTALALKQQAAEDWLAARARFEKELLEGE